MEYINAITGKTNEIDDLIINTEINTFNLCYEGRKYMLYIIKGIILIYKEKYIELEIHIEQMLSKNIIEISILQIIYAYIFQAVAKYYIYGLKEAEKAIMMALELAEKDNIIMPFVELAPHVLRIIKRVNHKNSFINRVVTYSEKYSFIYEKITLRKRTNILTNREMEIMEYLSKGYTQAEIAEALGLFIATIKKHSSLVYSKLGVKNKTMALRMLKNKNLIS